MIFVRNTYTEISKDRERVKKKFVSFGFRQPITPVLLLYLIASSRPDVAIGLTYTNLPSRPESVTLFVLNSDLLFTFRKGIEMFLKNVTRPV